MDILLNAANAGLLVAHGIRTDAEVGLVLLGPPDPPRFVRLQGHRLRSYQPDIRSNAALIRRALARGSRVEHEAAPGVIASKSSFEEALDAFGSSFVYLSRGGKDIRDVRLPADATYVLSDNQDLSADEERAVLDRGALVVSLGPVAIHADHAIAVLQNELDRRMP